MMSISSDAPKLRVVLYEGHGSRPVAAEERFAIFQTLLERGYAVTTVPSAGAGGQVSSVGSDAAVLVIGRFTERQPAEAEEHGGAPVFFRELPTLAPSPQPSPPVGDREVARSPQPSAAVGDREVEAIGRGAAEAVGDLVETVRATAQAGKAGAWKPWFPVIDYSRCTNCMQCLSFCLFDVYGVSTDEKIKVQHPSNCKTDCPACSRVCPEVAILFPKYKAGPINGDEVSQVDVEREKMKVDISALLGGDIYRALRERSERAKTRFAKERDDQRALDERRRCLVKLQQELDIPPEVLAALPTQDQIRERAARARAVAQEGKS